MFKQSTRKEQKKIASFKHIFVFMFDLKIRSSDKRVEIFVKKIKFGFAVLIINQITLNKKKETNKQNQNKTKLNKKNPKQFALKLTLW